VTPAEVAGWLGFPVLPPGRQVRQKILDGMAGVRVPGTGEEQIAAFHAFLACAGKSYASVHDEELTEEEP
jgi:hypothetical protein